MSGRVLELLINSEKTSTDLTFEENAERFLCSLFSVTRGHIGKYKSKDSLHAALQGTPSIPE